MHFRKAVRTVSIKQRYLGELLRETGFLQSQAYTHSENTSLGLQTGYGCIERS
jgi:hypothetical protein